MECPFCGSKKLQMLDQFEYSETRYYLSMELVVGQLECGDCKLMYCPVCYASWFDCEQDLEPNECE